MGTVHKLESEIMSPQSSLILGEGTHWHRGREKQIIDEKAFVAEDLFPSDELSKFQSGWFLLSFHETGHCPYTNK